jgi:FtsH-binding integral membrane protein
MFKLFQVMKEEGEDAVRRTIWIMCAATLFVIAVAFLAAASSIALSQVTSMPVALMISAGGVVIAGIVCMLVAGIDHHHAAPPSKPQQAPAAMSLLSSGGLIDQATQKMLLQQVKARPASVLAIAAAAGLAVAALDAFDGD